MSTPPPPPPGHPRVIVDTLDGVTTITAVGRLVGPPDGLRYTTAQSFTRLEIEHLIDPGACVKACAGMLCVGVGIDPDRVDLSAVAAAVIAGESRSFAAGQHKVPTDADIATLARAANVLLTRPGEEPAILLASRYEAEPGGPRSYNVVARDKHVAWGVAEVVGQMLRARGWPDAPVTVQSPGRRILPGYDVIYAAE